MRHRGRTNFNTDRFRQHGKVDRSGGRNILQVYYAGYLGSRVAQAVLLYKRSAEGESLHVGTCMYRV